MTLNLSEREMEALDQLAKDKDMNKTAVIRQALRLYQFVDQLHRDGKQMVFSDPLGNKTQLLVL